MILAIETAVERVGVAIGDGTGARASAMLASDRRHAESLAPMIDFVLGQAGLKVRDIDHIAVDVGPGLFTGMRVGMATAQSMAWALEIPVIPVSSLDALAFGHGPGEDPVAVALDARRGEVYFALYRESAEHGEPRLLQPPAVMSPQDAAIAIADRGETTVCIGSGFQRHAQEFETVPWVRNGPAHLTMPRAEDVLGLAALRAAREMWTSADAVEPVYLRAPDAEIHWQTREAAR